MEYLSSCDGSISLSIMSSGYIHVVACDRISFLKAESYSIVCVSIFFIHSPISEHQGCSHLSVIVNNAATNMDVLISLQDPVFNSVRYVYRSGITRSRGNSFIYLFFEEPLHCFPQHLHDLTSPPTAHRIPISPRPRRHLLSSVF